jgi:hypothetical protein
MTHENDLENIVERNKVSFIPNFDGPSERWANVMKPRGPDARIQALASCSRAIIAGLIKF